MAGIAGIIGKMRREQALEMLEDMLDAMSYEPFYSKGFHVNEELGLYVGWLTHRNSFSDCMPVRSGDRKLSLVFHGEAFTSGDLLSNLRKAGYSVSDLDATHLVPLYEQLRDDFFEELNGTFCGILADSGSKRLHLFNDRLGFEKLYYSESEDGIFRFSSEAKALLRVIPGARQFDPQGLAQFLSYGCTFEPTTLYKNISLIPPASVWEFGVNGLTRKRTYFRPEDWHTDLTITSDSFTENFRTTFRKVLPRYFAGSLSAGLSLTGGWDTRMIVGCHRTGPMTLPCYTFAGLHGETVDVRQARKVANVSRQDHTVLRLQSDFLTDFPNHAEKTIYTSDGNGSVCLSHEMYLNRLARSVAGVRVTGNFGSEVLRGMTTFKEIPLGLDRFPGDITREIPASRERLQAQKSGNGTHFAVFTEIPWKHAAVVRLANSQLPVRSPFLDNEVMRLACICPPSIQRDNLPISLLRVENPDVAKIPTDRGVSGYDPALIGAIRHAWLQATFKLDYLLTEGTLVLPGDPAKLHRVLPLRHKYLDYRRWLRGPLKGYVQDLLSNSNGFVSSLMGRKVIDRILADGSLMMRNELPAINALMTLELIDKCLLHIQDTRREHMGSLDYQTATGRCL